MDRDRGDRRALAQAARARGGGLHATYALAQLARIDVVALDGEIRPDLSIDGADEVDPELRLLKGGGGALLREKIVITAARRFVVVAETDKRVERLGRRFTLPVEVVRFALARHTAAPVRAAAGRRERRAEDGDPYLTDEGHYILDCPLPPDGDLGRARPRREGAARRGGARAVHRDGRARPARPPGRRLGRDRALTWTCWPSSAVCVAVIVSPGQDTALTIRNTIAGGRRGGALTALGVSIGQAVWTLAASAGVAALIVASEPAFVALKLAGAAYLVLLGARSLRDALRPRPAEPPTPPRTRRGGRRRGSVPRRPAQQPGRPQVAVFFTACCRSPRRAARRVLRHDRARPRLLLLTFLWLLLYAAVVAKAGDLLRPARCGARSTP